ncbi:hypothetical protein [Nocardiopsis potens]|uniref:hypothetical protein n=1 Tax=Nocardiopsis potens TaxID=1246458 RepID=UPI00034DD405|nr:hypothetical protein [Nocardiopsis potens]
MPTPHRPRSGGAALGPLAAIPAALLLAAAAGCSGAEEEPAAAPSSAPPSPTRSPAPEFEEVEDLDTYCRENSDEDIADGYPGAAEYAGEGPHPTAVFSNSRTNDADYSGHRLQEDGPYEEWLPDSPEEAALLACIDHADEGDEEITTCAYEPGRFGIPTGGGESVELPLYGLSYEYTVYELRTGEVVASGDVGPGSDGCPLLVVSDSVIEKEPTKVFTVMDRSAAQEAIEEAVQGAAD